MTAPLPDDLPPESPIYKRDTPEFRAAWLQVFEKRQQAHRETERRYAQAVRAAVERREVRAATSRLPANPNPPRWRTEPLTADQHAEQRRVLAERRQQNNEKRVRLRQKATEHD